MARKSASLVRRATSSSSNRDEDGTISTTNSCLASHRKKPPRCCESAYLSGNCAYRFRGKYFSATNQKRSSGCHGWRLTIGS